jgi:hypothetical protein
VGRTRHRGLLFQSEDYRQVIYRARRCKTKNLAGDLDNILGESAEPTSELIDWAAAERR